MKSFQERNPLIIAPIAIGSIVVIIALALNYAKLPFISSAKTYTAFFAEAGGLLSGSAVLVSGANVGLVREIRLEKAQVLVTFTVADDIPLGDRTEAAIKTKSLLGAKVLEVTPLGGGALSAAIPVDRTRSPYQLPDALGDLSTTISGLNTDQVSTSLQVLSETFQDTPPELKVAIDGVARFSATLNARDADLRELLANANKATGVLAERSDQVVQLIADTNSLLVSLQEQSAALDEISGNLSQVTQQIEGVIDENRETLKPALEKLNGVLTIVDNRKEKVQESIKRLGAYALSLGESVSSGPFFKAYLSNLLPGQFVQPFVDAAFSDLGLDPATVLPSDRTDPQVGQPGTPPLPVPYPRTGQGGEPRLTIPDAITGNPDDRQCGPAGVPLPGPGCYPYRTPLPAPPPGGPPPGPPALGPADTDSQPGPVYQHDPLVPVPAEPGQTPATAQEGQP